MGGFTVRSGVAMGVLGGPTSGLAARGGGAGFLTFTCDAGGDEPKKVDCEAVIDEGIADYCDGYVDRLMGGRQSLFHILKRLACESACQAAAADCYTVEYESYGGREPER